MWFIIIIPLRPIFLLLWWLVRAFLYLVTCKRVNLFEKKENGSDENAAEGGQVMKKVEMSHTHDSAK